MGIGEKSNIRNAGIQVCRFPSGPINFNLKRVCRSSHVTLRMSVFSSIPAMASMRIYG